MENGLIFTQVSISKSLSQLQHEGTYNATIARRDNLKILSMHNNFRTIALLFLNKIHTHLSCASTTYTSRPSIYSNYRPSTHVSCMLHTY